MKKSKLLMTVLLMMITLLFCGCNKEKEVSNDTKDDISEAVSKPDPGLQAILDAGKLKVGCKVDVPCFGYQNTSSGEYEGLEVDLAYAIAAEIFGVTMEEAKEQGLCKFQGVTAKTRGALLDNGEIDIVAATFTITEERKKSWNFSTPYIQDAVGLMCLKSSGFTTIKDLNNAIIGVAQGSTTKDAIEEYIKDNNLGINVEFQEFDGYPALSAALTAENIDIFSVDRAILAGYNDDTTMILPERFGVQDYGIATALYAKELTTTVDNVITKLLSSGELDKMIEHWGIE